MGLVNLMFSYVGMDDWFEAQGGRFVIWVGGVRTQRLAL